MSAFLLILHIYFFTEIYKKKIYFMPNGIFLLFFFMYLIMIESIFQANIFRISNIIVSFDVFISDSN